MYKDSYDCDFKDIPSPQPRITNRGDQPDGLRYEKAELTPKERAWTLTVLPARQFLVR